MRASKHAQGATDTTVYEDPRSPEPGDQFVEESRRPCRADFGCLEDVFLRRACPSRTRPSSSLLSFLSFLFAPRVTSRYTKGCPSGCAPTKSLRHCPRSHTTQATLLRIMVAVHENVWAFRGEDGLNRSHVPPIPLWVGFLRVAQLVIALLVLILAGVAAGGFGTGDVRSSYGGYRSITRRNIC